MPELSYRHGNVERVRIAANVSRAQLAAVIEASGQRLEAGAAGAWERRTQE